MRVAVYTCCFGPDFKPLIPLRTFENCHYYCFTNQMWHVDEFSPWRSFLMTEDKDLIGYSDEKAAKFYKIRGPEYFSSGGYDYSLYVDSSHAPAFCPLCLISKYLRVHDLAVFAHPDRDCLYDESQVCIDFGKGDASLIKSQVENYSLKRIPTHLGLAACTILLRRHTSVINSFNQAWWNHLEKYSLRDQISFPAVAYQQGLKYTIIEGNVYNNRYFEIGGSASGAAFLSSSLSD